MNCKYTIQRRYGYYSIITGSRKILLPNIGTIEYWRTWIQSIYDSVELFDNMLAASVCLDLLPDLSAEEILAERFPKVLTLVRKFNGT